MSRVHHCRGQHAWTRSLSLTLLLLAALVLGACERAAWDPTLKVGDSGSGRMLPERGTPSGEVRDGATTIALGEDRQEPGDFIKRGNATFVREVSRARGENGAGDVTLNFDGTDIREVARVILGDLLGVNYVLHPGVQGAASLQTGQPLRREHLIPTLETLLRMNGAALVQSGDRYEVVPVGQAIQGRVVPQLGETSRALPAGYSVQIVPLRYIGAEEMSAILEPLAPEGSLVRVDTLRNLVVIAGTSPEMSNLLDTIRVFDVDWMAGLSVGFFVLEFAKAGDVVNQLQELFSDADGSTLKGIFRFVPVETANALLVVSPQARYIEQARDWIERLDMAEASGDAAERLFVYRVKHGDAEALAGMLSELFGSGRSAASSRPSGGVAPGLAESSIGSDGAQQQGSATRATSREISLSSAVSIVADSVNNSLLVRASPQDYKKILDALKQLDIVPLQVLVEASILEITLSGNLEYGVQWDLFGGGNKDYSSQLTLDGALDNATQSGLTPLFPGFTWSVISRPETVRATLSALAGKNLVNVLSSPSVMVMDNQTATIQVGEEVPIATTQQQSTSTTDRVINTIEYRDTGIMLSVTPRVTPGGLVQMEIEQEVSTVVKTESSNLDSPSFQTRNITSSVAVRSNQPVVLGGLIQEQRSDGRSGVPGLSGLPFAGALFSERSKDAKRTELVVILTPKVIASDQDIEAVTADFRKRLRGLEFSF